MSPQVTIDSPVEQLIKDAVGDALIGPGPRTEPKPKQPVQGTDPAAAGGVFSAAEEGNAVEMMVTPLESAAVEFEEVESAAANELGSDDTAPAEADITTPAANGDEDGCFENAEIVELGEAQPTAGGEPSGADPETEREQPVPEAQAVVNGGGLVSPTAHAEEACVGDMALTLTGSASVEAEQAEVAATVELANVSTAPAKVDVEATAPAPAPATSELVSPDVTAEGTAPQGDGQPSAEKKQNNLFGFVPKLLGWGKKDNARSRVARVESVVQAAGGEDAAGETLVSTAVGDLEAQETAAQGENLALDGQTSNFADGAARMSAEGVSEPIETVPVSTETAAGQRPPGDVEGAELATTQEYVLAEVRSRSGLDIENYAISRNVCM